MPGAAARGAARAAAGRGARRRRARSASSSRSSSPSWASPRTPIPSCLSAALAGGRERGRGTAIERHGGAVHRALGALIVGVFGAPTAHEDDAARGRVRARAARSPAVPASRPARCSCARRRAGRGRGRSRARSRCSRPRAPASVATDALSARGARGWDSRCEHAVRRPRAESGTAARGAGAARSRSSARRARQDAPDDDVHRRRSSATVLPGRCLPYGSGITWWALREVVWELAGIALDDPGAVAEDKLRGLVERAVGEDAAARRRGDRADRRHRAGSTAGSRARRPRRSPPRSSGPGRAC